MTIRSRGQRWWAPGIGVTSAAVAVWLARPSLPWESSSHNGWITIAAAAAFAAGLALAFWARDEFLSLAAIVVGGLVGWVGTSTVQYAAIRYPPGYPDIPVMYRVWHESAWIVIGARCLGAACRWVKVGLTVPRQAWLRPFVVFIAAVAVFAAWWGLFDLLGHVERWQIQPDRVVVIIPFIIGYLGARWTGTAALTALAVALGVVSGLELAMLVPLRPAGYGWRWYGLLTTSLPLVASGALGAFARWTTALARRRGTSSKYFLLLGVTAAMFGWWMTATMPSWLHQNSYVTWVTAATLVAAAIGLAGTIWTRSGILALAAVLLGLQVGWEAAEIRFFEPSDGVWNWMRLISRELIAPLSVAGVIGAAIGWIAVTAVRRSIDKSETLPR